MLENKICINVLHPDLYIKKIRVDKLSTIRSLYRVLPEKDSIFIFKNEILTGSLSFCFYNIENDNSIVVVEPSVLKTIGDDILLYYQKCILITPSISVAKERNRLKDQKLMQLEMKPRLFRKVYCLSVMPDETSPQMTISYSDKKEISTSPLPELLW